ncbi:MAG TPA: IlvD/Edd family dehydratase [Mycobacteriales bacterium]|nr:IlvD/Edd family dehydratase [Mycobacteriales bacterium]
MALRSSEWFTASGKVGFVHRNKLYGEGFDEQLFDGRPVIGIANTWSELAPCNAHLRRVAESVHDGILAAGGAPLEFNSMSLGETLMRPTAMLFRNLLSIEIEETLRANPLDGVVLLSGCDKTTPAVVMGAASADLPAVLVTGGPSIAGVFQGQTVGSGTHVWKYSEEVRAGRMPVETFRAAERCFSRGNGHCNTMGTASTMACITEAMGLQLPHSASALAVDGERHHIARAAGRRAVELASGAEPMSTYLTRESFENAVRVNAALGGSTNAVIHLLAMAGRAGVPLSLADIDALSRDIPLLVDLLPSGQYLMKDFHEAGGVPAVLAQLGDLLHLDLPTVTGRTLRENIADVERWRPEVIRSVDEPLQPAGAGVAVLTGSLAPDGALVKQSAASPNLLQHRGRALVFDSIEEYTAGIDDPDLDVDADTVLVLRGAGPRGYPGMPEVGNLALPRKLLAAGVDDMVRISDARMSGTSYGTVVLHVAPESAVGGPLALVRTGDLIELDVPARRLELLVDAAELERRRAGWTAPAPAEFRGWSRLYVEHVQQADRGADLDFLVGRSGAPVPRPSL